MKKFFLLALAVFIGVIILLPKENLYYSAEKAFAPMHLFLDDEDIHNRLIYLDVCDATLLFDSIEIGSIEKIRLTAFVFYNQVSIQSINFNKQFSMLFPDKIDYLTFTYSILHPLSINIEGKGGFGPVYGKIDLYDGSMKLFFTPSREMRRYPLLLAKLYKSEGELVYETHVK